MAAGGVLVVQMDASDPVGRLGDWLAAAGIRLDIRRTDALPAALDDVAGLIVLGGSMAPYDDAGDPGLAQVRALLRVAVATELPTLGVCLGAQLLAAANGGQVGVNPDGPEFGAQLIAKRAAAATDPLFGAVPITPDVIQWHVDAVTSLPPGAVHLASSPTCQNQAFRVGRLAWGIQFHIETTTDVVRAWAAEHAAALDGYDADLLLSRAEAVHDDLAEVWAPFAAAFAAVVRDPDAVGPARTVAMSTAAPVTDPGAIRAAIAAEASASRGPASLPMPGLRSPGYD